MKIPKRIWKKCPDLKGSLAILYMAILLLLIVTLVPATHADPGDCLVLWNKLGSQSEIENSEVGPNGIIYGSGISFVAGKFGDGFTAGTSTTGPNFGSWEVINPNYNLAGTVEFWWRPARDFDEPSSSPDEIFVSGLWSDPWILPFQLMYRWRECNGIGGFDFQVVDESLTSHHLYTGKVVPFQADDWVHVAFVWDMNGLPNHPEVYYGTYVNGQYYPLVDCQDPGASINVIMAKPAGAYFSMGYYDADWNNRLEGVLDNVIIWNYAKTDFSDRFTESPLIPATIDIDPDTLNLKSQGEWVTAYIELPGSCDVNEIDVSTVKLITPFGEEVSVDSSAPATVGDYDSNGIPDLMVKFDRATVVEYLGTVDTVDDGTGIDEDVELTITGELTGGTPFEGSDTVRVIKKGK